MYRRRRGRTADLRTSGFVARGAVPDLVAGVLVLFGLLDHCFEVLESLDAVGEGVDDYFGAVGQTTATKGDEAIGLLLSHVVDNGNEIVPWRMRSYTDPCSHVMRAEGSLEILDVARLLR